MIPIEGRLHESARRWTRFTLRILLAGLVFGPNVASAQEVMYWMKIRAKDKFERSRLADTGISIEFVADDYVVAIGTDEEKSQVEKTGALETTYALTAQTMDFPKDDSDFHNYDELKKSLQDIAARYPTIATLDSIGRSGEGRELLHLRISKDPRNSNSKPGVVFMGGHHAREHLSIELPILLAKHLVESYTKGDPEIVRLVDGRDIHIIPMVNPDGAEYDIDGGRYKMWRKNRTQNDGVYGVDLNRNYGFKWGMGGSSSNPRSDTYMGPQPFSEPESRAIRDFIDKQSNITMLTSFHTYAELILYPWSYSNDPISETRDRQVYETMAKKMAAWNGYKAQQSSDLYISSGDTADWSYAEHKIFSFTFELDPASIWGGGFYPGQAMIPVVFTKNLKPCLYMIELADNPYRSLDPVNADYGLRFPLVD